MAGGNVRIPSTIKKIEKLKELRKKQQVGLDELSVAPSVVTPDIGEESLISL
jgi:hypothetical protein